MHDVRIHNLAVFEVSLSLCVVCALLASRTLPLAPVFFTRTMTYILLRIFYCQLLRITVIIVVATMIVPPHSFHRRLTFAAARTVHALAEIVARSQESKAHDICSNVGLSL